MLHLRNYIFLLMCLTICEATAQQDPFFMPFEGPVYTIPIEDMKNWKFSYGEQVHDYEQIATVSFAELKIPDTHIDIPFPGVDFNTRYGMILDSEMIVKQDGCYAFILSSDDGSKFWVRDQLIVDNDGTHGFRKRASRVFIDEGKYPVKIWYYQGFAHKYGITFDAQYIGETCPDSSMVLREDEPLSQKFNLSSNVLFDYDKSELKEESKASLDSLLNRMLDIDIKTITVIGHSCNTGTDAYNLKLSQHRADTIRDYLISKINKPGITYRSIGRGASEPLVDDDSEASKSKNRRVEIIVD